jgi:hypothetical protein
LVRKNDGGASYGRQAAARGGYVGVEVGRIRSSRMLAAATRVSNQVQGGRLVCVENSNWNHDRPLVSEGSMISTD